MMTRQQLQSILKWVVYAGIYGGLLMPLVFIPVVIFPFVFSKLIVFQVIVGLTFPAFCVLAWLDRQYRPRFHWLTAAIAAYFLALALSVVFAVDPFRAWWGNQERMNGLFTLLHFFAWLVMASSVLKTWTQWRRLLNYQAVLSAFMAVVALLQKVYPNLLLFPAGPRVGGLLDNPIYMAAYQIFNLFFLAMLFLKTSSKKARIFYAAIALIDIFAFFAAQSRGALLGLGAGVLFFAAYYGFFSKSKKARMAVVTAMVVLFGTYGVLVANRNTAFVQSLPMIPRVLSFDLGAGTDTRLIAWKIGWEGFLERPITGWGLDNFHILFNAKYNPHSLRYGSYETWFDRAHNTVVDVIAMTGILGFITFFGIFGALFFTVWRAFRKGWIDLPIAAVLTSLPVAYFVQNLFVFDHPAGFSMSYLMYALIIAATRGDFIGAPSTTAAGAPEEKKSVSVALWTFAVLELVVLALVWRTSIIPFHASRLAIQANQRLTNEQALAWMQEAGQSWTPYLDEQTFLLSRNLMSIAGAGNLDRLPKWQEMYALVKTLSQEEIRRHPNNTHTHFVYARLLDDMSRSIVTADSPLAEQEYLAAIKASPKRQQLWYGLARFYIQRGRIEEAVEISRNVMEFDQDLGQGHWTYGLTLMYDNEQPKEGSLEIIRSQTVPYPYAISDVRELIPLIESYDIQKDRAGVAATVERIAALPQPQTLLYLQTAYRLEKLGYPDLRDRALALAAEKDPTVPAAYQEAVNKQNAPAVVATSTSADQGQTLTGKGSSGPRK
ncbi:MAG: O-antigen ligase family protein [Patescibacteria group bacterium]